MGFLDLTGLDIQGTPDARDERSLAEVAAFAASDHMVNPTQETTEKYLELLDKNTDSVREYRWLDQEEYIDPARIGVILSEWEFCFRLRKLIPIRVNDWSARGMRGLSVLKNGKWIYVGAMQCGYMPEFSIMNFNEHELPTTEKYRGWRGTVLLRLILGGYITEEDAHREFGKPIENSASRQYREKLFIYRNCRREANG
jgi:hypothetical protein